MSDWQDYSEFWMLKDSITTVVEANGASVWDIRQSAGTLKVVGEQAPEVCPVCAHPKAYFEVHVDNF